MTYRQLQFAIARLRQIENNIADARQEAYTHRRSSVEIRDDAEARINSAEAELDEDIA